jgi:DNA-binding GntR family transcriptional regulator
MELKNERLVEFSPRRGCWVARMTPTEIECACGRRGGDLAETVESDMRLTACWSRRAAGPDWPSSDTRSTARCALMRSSIEFRGSELADVVGRHRSLIDGVRTRHMALIAAALQDHCLDPGLFAENE